MTKVLISLAVLCAAAFSTQQDPPRPLPSGSCTFKGDDGTSVSGSILKVDEDGKEYIYYLDNGEIGTIKWIPELKEYRAYSRDPYGLRYIFWDEEKKAWRYREYVPINGHGTLVFDTDGDRSPRVATDADCSACRYVSPATTRPVTL